MKNILAFLVLLTPIFIYSQENKINNDSIDFYVKNLSVDSVAAFGTSFHINTRYGYSYQDVLSIKLISLNAEKSNDFLDNIKEPILSTISSSCSHENIGFVDLRLVITLYFQKDVIYIGFGNGSQMTINNSVYFINLKILHELYCILKDRKIKRSIKEHAKYIKNTFGW